MNDVIKLSKCPRCKGKGVIILHDSARSLPWYIVCAKGSDEIQYLHNLICFRLGPFKTLGETIEAWEKRGMEGIVDE